MEQFGHELLQRCVDAAFFLVLMVALRLLKLTRFLFMGSHHKTESVLDNTKRAKTQASIMRELLIAIPSSIRGYVTMFHNGDHFLNNRDLIKQTRTVEIVRDVHVHYQRKEYTDLLMSQVPEELDLVMGKGASFFVTDKLAPSYFKHLNVEGQAVAGARQAILDKRGEPIGFVGLDFDTAVKPDQLDGLMDSYVKWLSHTI